MFAPMDDISHSRRGGMNGPRLIKKVAE